jgi:hypothetical protein
VTLYSKIARGGATGLLLLVGAAIRAQAPTTKPSDQPPEKTASADEKSEKAANPFQVQLLETHIRFEANGDSRKEVHTIVKLNNLAGAREFARLTFDYNRVFQQVEIPMVRISHANGGTSDVLPSAITDAPTPAVEKYPAYQDVRVKAVRILGLQEGDTIEYRVVTSTARHPLAPDFWLEHTFDQSGQVLAENYVIEILGRHRPKPRINPSTPATTVADIDAEGRSVYRWERKDDQPPDKTASVENSAQASKPDVVLSTFDEWWQLASRLYRTILPRPTPPTDKEGIGGIGVKDPLRPPVGVSPALGDKAQELTISANTDRKKLEAIYEFVSSRIATVDLPLNSTGFSPRTADEILSSGYATQEDKFVLLNALARAAYVKPDTNAILTGFCDKSAVPRPSVFTHLDILAENFGYKYWMDPSLEVAPFGVVAPVKEGCVLYLGFGSVDRSPPTAWGPPPPDLPFAAFQKVGVDARLAENGHLKAKVKYTMRGENELLLRVAFHKTPKEKWKDVAGLLALSDGFRGVITAVDASDPMATKEPFKVEYELTQEKFVDWAKKPVRIPALLPQIGLPDPSAKTAPGNIELGTPLDVETQLTLHLPAGTLAQTPAGTSVERDYATYASKYGLTGDILSASRRIHFLKRDVARDRAVDYSAFERAVQNDQAQYFVLERREAGMKTADVK